MLVILKDFFEMDSSTNHTGLYNTLHAPGVPGGGGGDSCGPRPRLSNTRI